MFKLYLGITVFTALTVTFSIISITREAAIDEVVGVKSY